MADVEFNLTYACSLQNFVAPVVGGMVGVAPGIPPGVGGLYIIANRRYVVVNRYMGKSNNLQKRFSSRQATCFELGFRQADLQHIYVWTGTVKYRNAGAAMWILHGNYQATDVILEGVLVNLEHLFIKLCQNLLGGTITNTLLVGAFANNAAVPLNATLITGAGGGYAAYNNNMIIVSGGVLP